MTPTQAHDAGLLPCAHCGGADISEELTVTDVSIRCNECRARILYLIERHESLEMARRRVGSAWNRRPAAPAREARSVTVTTGERWYLGSLNDALFITNTRPSPCGTDIPPDYGPGIDWAVCVHGLTHERAEMIVDRHNRTKPTQSDAREGPQPVAWRYRYDKANAWSAWMSWPDDPRQQVHAKFREYAYAAPPRDGWRPPEGWKLVDATSIDSLMSAIEAICCKQDKDKLEFWCKHDGSAHSIYCAVKYAKAAREYLAASPEPPPSAAL